MVAQPAALVLHGSQNAKLNIFADILYRDKSEDEMIPGPKSRHLTKVSCWCRPSQIGMRTRGLGLPSRVGAEVICMATGGLGVYLFCRGPNPGMLLVLAQLTVS